MANDNPTMHRDLQSAQRIMDKKGCKSQGIGQIDPEEWQFSDPNSGLLSDGYVGGIHSQFFNIMQFIYLGNK